MYVFLKNEYHKISFHDAMFAHILRLCPHLILLLPNTLKLLRRYNLNTPPDRLNHRQPHYQDTAHIHRWYEWTKHERRRDKPLAMSYNNA